MISVLYKKHEPLEGARFIAKDSATGVETSFWLKIGQKNSRRDAFIQLCTFLSLKYDLTALKQIGRGLYCEPTPGAKGKLIKFSSLHATVHSSPEEAEMDRKADEAVEPHGELVAEALKALSATAGK